MITILRYKTTETTALELSGEICKENCVKTYVYQFTNCSMCTGII